MFVQFHVCTVTQFIYALVVKLLYVLCISYLWWPCGSLRESLNQLYGNRKMRSALCANHEIHPDSCANRKMRSALRANRKICSAFYINLEIRSAFAQITRTNKTQIANHKTVLIENAITLRDEPHLLVIAHAHQIQRGHLAVAACAVTDGRHQAVFGWQVVCTNC